MKTILKEQDFEIKAVRVEMTNGTYEVRCALYHKGEKLGIMQTPMSKLDKNIYQFRNFRDTVSYPMMSNILEAVEDSYNGLDIIHQVKGVGWQYNKDGALVGFAGAKYLGEDGLAVEREPIDLPLKADGMRFDTVKKINDYSAGNIKRQVLLAVSLSAPISGALDENLVTALVGKTSVGKTICENLCRSFYSKVFNKTELDFDDTENYITQSLIDNKGIFVAIDDTSLADKIDFDTFVYRLANGTERGRMRRDSQLSDRGSWATSIMVSAEKSILANGKPDLKGKFRRLLELDIYLGDLFDSAEQAEMIKELSQDNNGVIAYKFVSYILRNKLVSSLKELLKSEVKSIRAVANSEDPLMNALCYKIGIITLSAKWANESIGFTFDIEGIRDCLLNICEENVRLAREMTDDTAIFKNVYEGFYADISKGSGEAKVTVDTETFKETSKKYYSRLKVKKDKEWKNLLVEHGCFIGVPGERVGGVRCYTLKRLEDENNA